jgi:molybdopterin-biosynthesis enzyme MoeA-like protein
LPQLAAPSRLSLAVGGGVGGAIGTLLTRQIGNRHARWIEEQFHHGGLLLRVRAWDADRERQAKETLLRHSGRDVNVHALV